MTGRLSRTIGMKMFSGQTINTEFRQLTSLSHTTHPVGWEELSARRQDVIDKAVSLLQEAYNFLDTYRTTAMLKFIISAPVLLAGEDVPVDGILGKLIRTDLTGRMGDKIPEDLPVFPVLEWLHYLAGLDKKKVGQEFENAHKACLARSCGKEGDRAADRIAENYAAILMAWRFLCAFAGISERQGDFKGDVIQYMNQHIRETDADREPWVWIMRTVIAEISAGNYRQPYGFHREGYVDDPDSNVELQIRTSDIMHHLKTNISLREIWNGLPVKSDRVLKQQLKSARVVARERVDPILRGKRENHMIALSVRELEKFGLSVAVPEEV